MCLTFIAIPTDSGIAGVMIIPEPASALLGMLGAFALLRRRR